MKINPNSLNNTRAIRGFKEATAVMERIDALSKFTESSDQTKNDYDTSLDGVLLDSIKTDVMKPGTFGPVKEFMNSGMLSKSQDSIEFRAKIAQPWGTETVTRNETPDSIMYRLKDDQGSQGPGPDTTKITYDKTTGEIDFRKYWMGFIPARIDFGRV